MQKALCVGINEYDYCSNLNCCVNDATAIAELLERNGDGSLNFQTKTILNRCTTQELRNAIKELFENDSEIATFYYAGHGSFTDHDGYLCTSNIKEIEDGLPLSEIIKIAENSTALNKVIILDSCHSGMTGNFDKMSGYSILKSGTTILAACDDPQTAVETGEHGLFTSLLIEALDGGAMNLLGQVSPAEIYSFVDSTLGAWGQRPIFKANIKSFVSLRTNIPPIKIGSLHRLAKIFETPRSEFLLDPTFEPDKHEADTKEVNKENEEIFELLQEYVKLNLVTPVGEKHMYYAALNRKSCKLTAKGQHYWKRIKNKTL